MSTNRYFYKDTDISTLIEAGGTNQYTGFTNFPTFKNSTEACNKIDSGFINVYTPSQTDIKAVGEIMNTSGTVTMPASCNAIKIKVIAKSGPAGAAGAGGNTSTTAGAQGSVGANGDRNGCSFGQGAGGSGGPGGAGGAGGSGGFGGPGGNGGDATQIMTSTIYNIPATSTVSVDINNIKVTVMDGATTIFSAQGIAGAQGNQGGQGGVGNAGSQGAQGGQGGGGYCSGGYGRTGGTGSAGAQGALGTQGSQGAQGAQGAQGTGGNSSFFVLSGTSIPSYTFTKVTSTTSQISVFFFLQ
jgi:hypothetical protein